jgi:hypothetical protein
MASIISTRLQSLNICLETDIRCKDKKINNRAAIIVVLHPAQLEHKSLINEENEKKSGLDPEL